MGVKLNRRFTVIKIFLEGLPTVSKFPFNEVAKKSEILRYGIKIKCLSSNCFLRGVAMHKNNLFK